MPRRNCPELSSALVLSFEGAQRERDADWGGDEALRTFSANSASPKAIVLHTTGGIYSVKAMTLAIAIVLV
ncbi:hypothetical protein DO72_5173 [Burkholderia pseudomallei]|nr:hypothetical protein DO70_3512 [Burkholderia pseudomallei]KGD42636.1 hypothetical protein DO72_5173 [Burkholderia pseudomallei]